MYLMKYSTKYNTYTYNIYSLYSILRIQYTPLNYYYVISNKMNRSVNYRLPKQARRAYNAKDENNIILLSSSISSRHTK